LRTVGVSAALIAVAVLATGCLGTRSDEQNPNPNAQGNTPGQNGAGQFAQYGAQSTQNAYGQVQQPQAAPAAQPGQYNPQAAPGAPPAQAAPQGPFGALPQFQLPGFPAMGPASQSQPSNNGAQPQGQPQQGGAQPGPFGGLPGPGQPSTGSATPIDPNVASVATVPLMAYAIQEAPNMNREGGIIAGQFREGQTLEQPMQLAPNKCYTVLAVGAGPQEVDISIVAVTPIPASSPVLASDNTTGPNASLGGRGNCYRWQAPIGINAKFVVKSTRGMGIIAAQLYSK
jgi:hypothetical protein